MIRSAKWSAKRLFPQPSAVLAVLVVVTVGCAGEDAPPEIPLEERTPKVLLIGIDGVRPDVLDQVATPAIDRLTMLGTYTSRARTTTPSVSGPSWSSMLTGVWPEKHGVLSNDFVSPAYDRYPDFLTRIERARPELTTFAAVDWMPLMELSDRPTAVGRDVDVRVALDGYQLGWAEADARVVTAAVETLQQGDPDALFVYLGNPDETSHQHGSIGAEYREAIARADTEVDRLLAAVRARPSYPSENWLVLVSTDHGRREDGGHGGDSPEEMSIFILVSGPSAEIGTPTRPTAIVDIAPTALAHMGIAIDPAWELDGEPLGLRR